VSAVFCRNLRREKAGGSILIYVLWILAVISALAFRLSALNRSDVLQQAAQTRHLKEEMQLMSALRLAGYRIQREGWKGGQYRIKLNQQDINIEIINESGYIGLHDLGSASLKKALKAVGLDPNLLAKRVLSDGDASDRLRINDIDELLAFEGIDEDKLWRLGAYVSIFNDGPVNPSEAPPEVLMVLSRVDQYRVRRLMEETDENERRKLREEIVNLLNTQDTELTDELSTYYRVIITIGEKQYRATIRYDRAAKRFKTLALMDGKPTEVINPDQ